MTLYLDFETSPIVGFGWRMFTKGAAFFHVLQDVQITAVGWAIDDGPISCIAICDFPGYKPGVFNINDKKLVEFFAPKIEAADYVVAQNGFGFDFKLWRTRLIVHGMQPHHEPKEMDTKRWSKSKFLFTSNSQDNLSRQLGTSRKIEKEEGLFVKAIQTGEPKYWRALKYYCRGDVKGLRENAKRLAPFITNLPNANVLNRTLMECTSPLCPGGGKMNIAHKNRPTATGMKTQYQCSVCGHYATGPHISSGTVLR